MSNVGIHIGGANAESTKVVGKTIMDILKCPHTDEKTKQIALKTLGKGVEAPQHTTVSGCNIKMKP